jgi:hypothetical protein
MTIIPYGKLRFHVDFSRLYQSILLAHFSVHAQAIALLQLQISSIRFAQSAEQIYTQ